TEAAEAAGVSARTAGKWVRRYRAEGEAGLLDRSSAPRRVRNLTPHGRVEAIAALRRLRMTGPEIAELLGMATSTVSAVLARIGLGRLSRLDPPEPVRRYERSRPGELIHVDVKKLGRIGPNGPGYRVTGRRKTNPKATDAAGRRRRQVGWERVHVCVDDATRLAYVEVLPDEKATTAIGFLRRAVAFYRSHGITVERLMTDNGPAYVSTVHAIACRALGIRHIRTRPRRPQTNFRASSRIAFESSSALCARTLARSRPSGLDKDPALAERLVQHGALEMAPFLGIRGADDDHVQGHPQTAQLPPQSRRLRTPLRQLAGLDHEQIEIGIRPSITARPGAEEDYPRVWGGSRKAAARLGNQDLVVRGTHAERVAASRDGGGAEANGDPPPLLPAAAGSRGGLLIGRRRRSSS
ncbi:MAG TPA: IS481 family transposase, partial [Solirubrobacterales bacterium]|nr:IS481 family transposase [Solirubrobacterales bacterium]